MKKTSNSKAPLYIIISLILLVISFILISFQYNISEKRKNYIPPKQKYNKIANSNEATTFEDKDDPHCTSSINKKIKICINIEDTKDAVVFKNEQETTNILEITTNNDNETKKHIKYDIAWVLEENKVYLSIYENINTNETGIENKEVLGLYRYDYNEKNLNKITNNDLNSNSKVFYIGEYLSTARYIHGTAANCINCTGNENEIDFLIDSKNDQIINLNGKALKWKDENTLIVYEPVVETDQIHVLRNPLNNTFTDMKNFKYFSSLNNEVQKDTDFSISKYNAIEIIDNVIDNQHIALEPINSNCWDYESNEPIRCFIDDGFWVLDVVPLDSSQIYYSDIIKSFAVNTKTGNISEL